ncbi:hypothetical protein [Nocardia africana]|uniref:Uncharacterized protein n=1 Tax=Nocardia africana TaxID=134964 RepID=A0A378WIV5_9NOCA|nr:hypothetical protein [Nocardia africana]MCC3316428.1 hypothetical protein [Nocardia africana]SUA41216.1 Uncharacterised protein [Nocardia africana]
MAGEVETWKKFAEQARGGELCLDNEAVARECLAACDTRLAELQSLFNVAQLTQRVSGFGDFDMGHALEGGYLKQATGEPNSIDQVIKDHMETVKNMREVMAQSIKHLTGQDVAAAGQIAATDPAGR